MHTNIKKPQIILYVLSGFLTALMLCSCATKEWTSAKISSDLNARNDKLISQLNDNLSEAKNFYAAQRKLHEPEAVRQKIIIYRKLNEQAEILLIRCAASHKEFLAAMDNIEHEITVNSTEHDKQNFIKTQKAAFSIADKLLREWYDYSWRVYEMSAGNYNIFFERTSLYELSAHLIRKNIYCPLNMKSLTFLNQPEGSIQESQQKAIDGTNDFISNFNKQELIYSLDSLYNCRKFGTYLNKALNIDKSSEPWIDEAKFLTAGSNNNFSTPELNGAKQTLLINRAYVCDIIIRKMELSQNYPMELAYFIDQIDRINALLEPGLYTTDEILKLKTKYIDNFNTRSPMDGPQITKIKKFKQGTKNVYQNP
ncbi:MAG: hypothetical protein WCI51_09255 [Lentisphaerota bacterium]